MAVVDALAREVGSVGQLLHTLKPKQWEQPTRCPPMNVRELSAHMLRGAVRIQEMLDAGPVDAEPEKDAVTYFQFDSVSEAPVIVKRAQESAAAFPADLARTWDLEWTKSLQRARMYLGDTGSYESVVVYDADRLRPGNVLAGPAVIEAEDTTVLVQVAENTKIRFEKSAVNSVVPK